MSESTDADKLAEKLLDEPYADSDDDLRMLSRQLLRRNEVIDRLKKDLNSLQDPMSDLVNSNRDEMLKKHEEAVVLIRKMVDRYIERAEADNKPIGWNSMGAGDLMLICRVLDALASFHPMHGESWPGWPKVAGVDTCTGKEV